MLETILYLLTGVLTYIIEVVYKGRYGDNIDFLFDFLLWPLMWVVFLLNIIKSIVDFIAYQIMRLVGKR